MWLLAYEGSLKGWIGNNQNHIKNDIFFSHLFTQKISFYEQNSKCRPLFDIKSKVSVKLTIESIKTLFDSDKNIDDLFDFEDVDDEYFDSDSSSESEDEDLDLSEWDLFDFGEEI